MKVEWTEQALEDAAVMAEFIAAKWTTREVLRFFEMLAEFERTVAILHVSYPRSEAYPGCHRARIHRNASVIYRKEEEKVSVLAVVDNRSSRPK